MSESISAHKVGHLFKLSDEMAFEMASDRDPRYKRRVKEVIRRAPTPEQLAEFERVKAAWEIVSNSQYFEDGGPDYGATLNPPQDEYEYIYAETHDEWLARCRGIAD